MHFEQDVLPRLASAYQQGRLVPFIASGLSVPACTGWLDFIKGLEQAAGIRAARGAELRPEELVRRANRAVRLLKARDGARFPDRVRRAMTRDGSGIPAQSRALARIWWPLVLTLNYDDCYLAAFEAAQAEPTAGAQRRRIELVGRNPADCQRVLTALHSPSRALLWQLQGYVGGPCMRPDSGQVAALSRELVVGHDEYRRVTFREPHFRRAFAEVFRTRSLFFLGCGLSEPYLQDLFGEILEMFGPGSFPHYALMRRGEVPDLDFMRARFQVEVIEYDDHADLPAMLDRLRQATRVPPCKTARWSYSIGASDDDLPAGGAPADLEIVRGRLPLPDAALGECLAVSAGGSRRRFYFSPAIGDLLEQAGVGLDEQPDDRPGVVRRFASLPVYGVLARGRRDLRDLASIAGAAEQLFDRAARDGFRRIHMQLLGTGGKHPGDAPEGTPFYEVRLFPERFSFVEIVRAFGRWRHAHPRRRLGLSLYVIDPSVYLEIANGRLDVTELVSCRDLRFWGEIVSHAGVGEVVDERRLFQEPPDTTVRDLLQRLNLPDNGWSMHIVPAPSLMSAGPQPIGRRLLAQTLARLGVAPGSTLRFRRVGGRRRESA